MIFRAISMSLILALLAMLLGCATVEKNPGAATGAGVGAAAGAATGAVAGKSAGAAVAGGVLGGAAGAAIGHYGYDVKHPQNGK